MKDFETIKSSLISLINNHPDYHKSWDRILFDSIVNSNKEKPKNSDNVKWERITPQIRKKLSKINIDFKKYGRVGNGDILRLEIAINKTTKIFLIKRSEFPSKRNLKSISRVIRDHENIIWNLLINLNKINYLIIQKNNTNKKITEDYNSKFKMLKILVDEIRPYYKKEKNKSATSFLETTIGAGIWYLGENCSGIISLEVLSNIIFKNKTLSKVSTADHIFPRKNVGFIIMKKSLKLETMQKEYHNSWSQVAYVTKDDNQNTKKENQKNKSDSEFSIKGRSNFKKIKFDYINYFKRRKNPLLDTGLKNKLEFFAFIDFVKINLRNPEDLVISKLNRKLKTFLDKLNNFKKSY